MKDKYQTPIFDSGWFASDSVQRVMFSSCKFHSTPGIYDSIALSNYRLGHNTIGSRNQNILDCARRQDWIRLDHLSNNRRDNRRRERCSVDMLVMRSHDLFL